jgi:hypothetical protein
MKGMLAGDTYTDVNDQDWKLIATGDDTLGWHFVAHLLTSPNLYGAPVTKTISSASSAHFSFADAQTQMIDQIDGFVSSWNADKPNTMASPKGSGWGVIVLVLLVAFAMSDKRKR